MLRYCLVLGHVHTVREQAHELTTNEATHISVCVCVCLYIIYIIYIYIYIYTYGDDEPIVTFTVVDAGTRSSLR